MTAENKRRVVSGGILLVCLAAVVVLTLLFQDKLIDVVRDPESFRQRVDGHYFTGRLIFVGLCAVQVVLAIIPGIPFEIAGGYCFGIFDGALLTSLGILLGSAAAFWLSRLFGLRIVKLFYSEEKLQKATFLKESKRANAVALTAFVLPGLPKDMMAYVLGVTEMRMWIFVLISTLGRLPGILLSVVCGAVFGTSDLRVSLIFGVITVGVVALFFLVYFSVRRKKKRAPPAPDNEEADTEQK